MIIFLHSDLLPATFYVRISSYMIYPFLFHQSI